MKNQKIIFAALGVLVFLNIVLLSMVFIGKPCHGEKKYFPEHGEFKGKPGHGFHPMNFFEEEVNLNEEQKKNFNAEMDSFMSRMNQLREEKSKLKNSLFVSSLSNDSIEAILNNIAENERKFAQTELAHFATLKKNLNKTQQEKFDTVLTRMMRFRKHPPMKEFPPMM